LPFARNLTEFLLNRDTAADENDKEKEKLEDALGSAIVKEKPNIKWADVAGLE